MQKRDILIMAIAGVCGLLGFFFLINVMRKPAQVVKVMPQYKCVIAQAPIAKGQIIDSKNAAVGGPVEVADAGSVFFQFEDAAGWVALEDIPKGSVVERAKVKKPAEAPKPEEVTKPKPSYLPIPQGMRGLPLGAEQVEVFPYGLKIGNFVDIFGMVSAEGGKSERRCIVKGAQLVMVEEGSNGTVLSIVIALPPRAVDIVMKAVNEGKLRLVPGPDPGGKMTFTQYGYAEIIRGVTREKAYQTVQGTSQAPAQGASQSEGQKPANS
jgi:hypothetical protein